MEERRKNTSFLILKLASLIKHYHMEHDKLSDNGKCYCALCIEASKLLEETSKPRWKKKK